MNYIKSGGQGDDHRMQHVEEGPEKLHAAGYTKPLPTFIIKGNRRNGITAQGTGQRFFLG